MRAKYYRFLFHNAEGGLYYTGSIVDNRIDQTCNFIYISGLKASVCGDGEPDERFCDTSEYHLMFLADLNPFSVCKAMYTLKNAKVSKVIMPEYSAEELKAYAGAREAAGGCGAEELEFITDPYQFMENAGVNDICRINSVQTFVCNGWLFRAAAFGDGIHKSLAVYHGPADVDKKQEDTLMTVKYFSKLEPCSVCIDLNTASCGMKCGLYNDFDVCKKHNGAGGEEYVDGCLLLGSVNLNSGCDSVRNCFEEFWNKIRFISVPNGGSGEEWNKEILNAGPEGYKQYFVMPRKDKDNMQAIRDISFASPFKQLVVTSEDYGLCCSGFYKRREMD